MSFTRAIPIVKAIAEKVKFEDSAKVVDATTKLAVLADKHSGKIIPIARAIAKAVGHLRHTQALPTPEVLPDTAFDLTAVPLVPDSSMWDAVSGFDYGSVDALAWGW